MPQISPTEVLSILGMFCFVLLGIVAIVIGILSLLRRPGGDATWRREERQQFPADGLIVEVVNPVGSIEVHGEGQDQIVVYVQVVAEGSSTEEAKQRTQQVRLHMTQVGNRLLLSADQPPRLQRANIKIHWQVRLPVSQALRLEQGIGPISLVDLTGTVDAQTATGDIQAKDCRFAAPTTLHTSTGAINWAGAMRSTAGSYKVHSSTGAVSIALPADSAFHLEVQTSLGDVQTDPAWGAPSASGVVGHQFSRTINGGGPTLSAQTTTGNIKITTGA